MSSAAGEAQDLRYLRACELRAAPEPAPPARGGYELLTRQGEAAPDARSAWRRAHHAPATDGPAAT